LRPQVSEEESACILWLDSPLFAGGIEKDAVAYAGLIAEETSAEALRVDALRQPLVGPLNQPLPGVRLSADLNVLERAVMAALLHHVGALAHVLTTETDTRADVQALRHCVSLAAREVRVRVMSMRDADNMALKEGEQPKDWAVYTQPFISRCKLVLCAASLRMPNVWSGDGEGHMQAADVAQAIALVRVCACKCVVLARLC
jgi:hypothetical protein